MLETLDPEVRMSSRNEPLKTLLAAEELVGYGLSERTGAAVLAGVNRYLHSPTRLKHVRRTVHQAMQFVAKDG